MAEAASVTKRASALLLVLVTSSGLHFLDSSLLGFSDLSDFRK
jgi:hypothetical protein